MSNRGEQSLLKQSTFLMFAVAIAGICTGFITGAQSILFDGFFSLVATFIKVLMLITARLIAKESNHRFQFGFWHLEPMVLLIEGSFLLLIAIYAFLNGVSGIINGGREIELGMVIIYAAVFTVVEFGYFFYVRYRNRTLKSSLIQFDNISWLVDAMLSVGLLVSFLVALLLKSQGYGQWAMYVDPLILILLALSMLAPAFKILRPALRDVLGIAPDHLDDTVRQVMDAATVEHGFEDYVSYVQKHGRARFIEIHIVLPADYRLQTVGQLDAIREQISARLGQADATRWLTICFTGDRKWIA
ncbi:MULTISPECIES: cation diffusion facilitator family transporter [Pseudomonas]|uniref:cation diffusion facilitator family transporter n=1 Tax=Pseudomonas TaxID=286 RepID=UPI00069E7941|nr:MULTISPECIES: cation diffusion facilitator family transporter [Pseudomonas]NHN68710.1 cation diffusion facilitator family transporter [Pseudomonas fluorescens]MDT8904860.1 cation diffusion facilitator family transporter [Pseudomonas prosekii]ROO31705.1 cation diffusion facilitator family transporter [Pseudomonas sp. 7SR1]ROO38067.1 cation diffusion facilitator family transporter [Pseudomonas sp. AF76]SCX44457.1 cation diffusion facilitator family transporter [Pseudomonas sp. NFACC32-1]